MSPEQILVGKPMKRGQIFSHFVCQNDYNFHGKVFKNPTKNAPTDSKQYQNCKIRTRTINKLPVTAKNIFQRISLHNMQKQITQKAPSCILI